MDLIGDLELMQDLAERGSFSAVARGRGQAPSSISRRLDRLEAHVGERLFNRAPTGLFLTDTGVRKLREARELTSAAAAFVERDGADGDLRGHIAVSAPARLGEVCVVPIVASFLDAHPKVSVDLHMTDVVQDLDRDRIDLAVRIGADADDHHVIRRIADNHRLLVASPAYLAPRPEVARPEDLEGCDGLLLGSAFAWRLQGPNGVIHKVKPRSRLKCVSGDALLAMCLAGLGVALKSFWDVRRAVDDGRLVHILPEWKQASPANIMIVMPDRRLVSPTLRTFATELEGSIRSRLAELRS